MQVILHSLKQSGIHTSWKRIQKEMSTQVRVTTSTTTKQGKLLRIRGTTNPEPMHQAIYKALNISSKPAKTAISYY